MNDSDHKLCSPFSNEDEISQTMINGSSLALLDSIRQHGKGRGQAGIPFGEHIDVRAFGPVNIGRCMDSLLHICTIKVQRSELDIWERATGKSMGGCVRSLAVKVQAIAYGKPRTSHKTGKVSKIL
jgi:hypothetical protein